VFFRPVHALYLSADKSYQCLSSSVVSDDPKLNGCRDNGQRKLCSSGLSTHCTCQLTRLINVCLRVWCPMTTHSSRKLQMCFCTSFRVRCFAQSAMLRQCLPFMFAVQCLEPKDNYAMTCKFFVVECNGFISFSSYFHVTYIFNSTETIYSSQF
jgi:hypothetical protein